MRSFSTQFARRAKLADGCHVAQGDPQSALSLTADLRRSHLRGCDGQAEALIRGRAIVALTAEFYRVANRQVAKARDLSLEASEFDDEGVATRSQVTVVLLLLPIFVVLVTPRQPK